MLEGESKFFEQEDCNEDNWKTHANMQEVVLQVAVAAHLLLSPTWWPSDSRSMKLSLQGQACQNARGHEHRCNQQQP